MRYTVWDNEKRGDVTKNLSERAPNERAPAILGVKWRADALAKRREGLSGSVREQAILYIHHP